MASKLLADKTALVIDQGLYVHVAERLALEFGHVFYFCDWRSAFPVPARHHIGYGLAPNIQPVINPWLYMDQADVVVFPDVYFGGEQEFLRTRIGKRVWGSGLADGLELYRTDLKKVLADLDLPTGKFEVIVGVDKLRDYLKAHTETLYVKGNLFRGTSETFKHTSYATSKRTLDRIDLELGPRAKFFEFIVERPIEGPEFGYDASSIDGQFSNFVSWGYEDKDSWYLGRIVRYDDLPPEIKSINAKLAPLFEEMAVRSFFSTEMRKDDKGNLYVMDPCMRAGSPPSEVYIQAFRNWGEHIYHGGAGDLVDLEPEDESEIYLAEIILQSDEAGEGFFALEFPEEVRPFVKIHAHCRVDDIDYSAPLGIHEFGAAIGRGKSLEAAITQAKDVASQIKGMGIHYNEDASDAIGKIEEGVEYGVEW